MAFTNIVTYTVAHGKNGSGGGITKYGNGRASQNVNSISAKTGNISDLTVNNLTANKGNILYLTSKEGEIYKLSGKEIYYDHAEFGDISLDYASFKKLKVDDLEALNAFIETLNSKKITTEYLTVTKQAHFFELIIDKIRSVGGQIILSAANCIIDWVYAFDSSGNEINLYKDDGTFVDNIDTVITNVAYFDVYWRNTSNDGHAITNDFIANDQVICQSFNGAQEGTSHNVANKYYWRLVNTTLGDAYINLTTGARSTTAVNNSFNSYMVGMNNSYIKNYDETYSDNGITWECRAQAIDGIQTGVTWTPESGSYPIYGRFDTSSQMYGLQIEPVVNEGETLPITNKIVLSLKQIKENLNMISYGMPNKINVGIYFNDNTFLNFNDVEVDSTTYEVEFVFDDVVTSVAAITIVSAEENNWHMCHAMRISNIVCDEMVYPSASIPTPGDNLVQLGYRGTDDDQRQCAIMISAYNSRDNGGLVNGFVIPPLVAPYYAQYIGINDFDLASHRQTYMDANGAKFVGDITMCSVNDKALGEALETNNKKIITSTETIQVYEGQNNTLVKVPDSFNISILMPDPESTGGETLLTSTVPHGYVVKLTYYDNLGQALNDPVIYREDAQMVGISPRTGATLDAIRLARIELLKEVNGEQMYNYPVVDIKDIGYISCAESGKDGANGGNIEFRYQNSITEPPKPIDGSDGVGNGWYREATTPDFAHGYYTWMTQCFKSGSGSYGEWTRPIRITGDNGQNGEDGELVEFIYTENDTGTAPSAPVNDAYSNPVNVQDDWNGFDSNGVRWYDNPQGVSVNIRYEFISMRSKAAGETTWSAYSTPVVWSKWGDKGQDGDGYEYIYLVNNTYPTPPANPTPQDISTDQYQERGQYAGIEYIPTGWYDEPQEISQQNKYQWCCVRKRTSSSAPNSYGTWGPFYGPVLWARYSEKGDAGGHYEFRYKNATTQPSKPADNTDGTTGGWSATPTNPDLSIGEVTWMTQCFVNLDSNDNNVYGIWTTPIRITGAKGDTGADGDEVEFIYKHFTAVQTWTNDNNNPAYWAAVQSDDYFGPTGYTWNDNPEGVDSTYMYEYVAVRQKTSGTWGQFSTPVIWSKWGEKGQDGDGYEYIYLVNDTYPTPPTNPTPPDTTTDQYQEKGQYEGVEYVPTGWHDEPQEISQATRFQWCCVRRRIGSVWGSFVGPVLWSRYADRGETGAHYAFRYKNATSQPTKPSDYTDGTTGGWSATPTNPDLSIGEATWMTQCLVTPNSNNNDSYGTWTTPIRITGANGKDGADGNEIEFIYKHFSTTQTWTNNNNNPAYWAASQTEDYLGPTGYTWSDNPQGVDSTNMYEYVAVREKTNGTWGTFTTPVIWSKWGEKGQDGDGFEYVYRLSGDVASVNKPYKPSNWTDANSDYQIYDEYVSHIPSGSNEGWSDDPQSVSSDTNSRICWVSSRKRYFDSTYNRVMWHDWTTPAKWSNYVRADQPEPGEPGEDAEYNYLIPTKETCIAQMLSALSTGTGTIQDVQLKLDLQYSLVHVKGDTSTTMQWSSQSWYIRLSAWNNSFNRINNKYWYITSSGLSNSAPSTGSASGTLVVNNFLSEISGALTDYMKCYEQRPNYCPIYFLVELMKDNNTVLDTRTVYVNVETGAVFKVKDNAIDSAVAKSQTNMENYLQINKYSKMSQTADGFKLEAHEISAINVYDTDHSLSKQEIQENYAKIDVQSNEISLSVTKNGRTTTYKTYESSKVYTKNEVTQNFAKISVSSDVITISVNDTTTAQTYTKDSLYTDEQCNKRFAQIVTGQGFITLKVQNQYSSTYTTYDMYTKTQIENKNYATMSMADNQITLTAGSTSYKTYTIAGVTNAVSSEVTSQLSSITLSAEDVDLGSGKKLSSVFTVSSNNISMETNNVTIKGPNSTQGKLIITNTANQNVIALSGNGTYPSYESWSYSGSSITGSVHIDPYKIKTSKGNVSIELSTDQSYPRLYLKNGSYTFEIYLNSSGKVMMGGSTTVFPTTQTRGYVFKNNDDYLEMST